MLTLDIDRKLESTLENNKEWLKCVVNSLAAQNVVTQGAEASVTMVLT